MEERGGFIAQVSVPMCFLTKTLLFFPFVLSVYVKLEAVFHSGSKQQSEKVVEEKKDLSSILSLAKTSCLCL